MDAKIIGHIRGTVRDLVENANHLDNLKRVSADRCGETPVLFLRDSDGR